MANGGSEEPTQAEKPKGAGRSWWRRRIPTPVVVTFIGLVLSAWLLPAFTRQWDDRQKAHELKAAIVTDFAAATAPMLARGEEIHVGGGRVNAVDQRAGWSEWSRAKLEIEARLNAYFSRNIVLEWKLLSYFVDYIDPTITFGTPLARRFRSDAATEVEIATTGPTETDVEYLTALAPLINPRRGSIELDTRLSSPSTLILLERSLSRSSEVTIIRRNVSGRVHRRSRFTLFEQSLLSFQTAIANEVLAADPTGYSTTTGDLLRDLIP
jgi:hypothetical protein